jgi:hypothetical protein
MALAGRRKFVGQAPWIAVLLQLMHDVIGHSVTFFFRQFGTKAAHKFARLSARMQRRS